MPVINRSIDGFQFYAGSVPSGDVGGDLVDLIERDGNRWMAYLADVSGHGVAAGALMGMFKTATRTRVMTPGTSLDRSSAM